MNFVNHHRDFFYLIVVTLLLLVAYFQGRNDGDRVLDNKNKDLWVQIIGLTSEVNRMYKVEEELRGFIYDSYIAPVDSANKEKVRQGRGAPSLLQRTAGSK